MLEATATNAITNAMHASFLLAYFFGARRAKFPRPVVWLFLLLVVLKIMGVYVHYAPDTPVSIALWCVIAVSTVAMNYTVMREARVPTRVLWSVLGICVAATGIFLTGVEDFSYIALPTALVFGIAARSASARLRTGLAMVCVSNIVWFAARKIGMLVAGGEVEVKYRYDNDLYHFLLIASTFVIFQGFLQRQKKSRSEDEQVE